MLQDIFKSRFPNYMQEFERLTGKKASETLDLYILYYHARMADNYAQMQEHVRSDMNSVRNQQARMAEESSENEDKQQSFNRKIGKYGVVLGVFTVMIALWQIISPIVLPQGNDKELEGRITRIEYMVSSYLLGGKNNPMPTSNHLQDSLTYDKISPIKQ